VKDDRDPPAGDPPEGAPPAAEPVLTVAQHTLVRHAMDVVERAAKRVSKRFRRFVKAEDLLAVGWFELRAAAIDFDESYSHDFAVYAYHRVCCAMVKAVGEELFQDRVRRAVDIATDNFWAYLTDREFNVTKHDDREARRRFRAIANGMLAAAFMAGVEEAQRVTPESESAGQQAYEIAIRALREALRKLSDTDHELLFKVYSELKDLKEAGVELGLPYINVRRRHANALAQIREELVGHGVKQAPRPRDVPQGGNIVPFRARGAPGAQKPPG
jgi:RNA polymerase sigma factor (sigma-70 family)